MLSKLIFNPNTLRLMRGSSKRCMSDYSPAAHHKEATLNDIPIPTESFESGYKRRQVGNNFVFAAGTLFFLGTFYYVFNSGVIFINLTPPKKNLPPVE